MCYTYAYAYLKHTYEAVSDSLLGTLWATKLLAELAQVPNDVSSGWEHQGKTASVKFISFPHGACPTPAPVPTPYVPASAAPTAARKWAIQPTPALTMMPHLQYLDETPAPTQVPTKVPTLAGQPTPLPTPIPADTAVAIIQMQVKCANIFSRFLTNLSALEVHFQYYTRIVQEELATIQRPLRAS